MAVEHAARRIGSGGCLIGGHRDGPAVGRDLAGGDPSLDDERRAAAQHLVERLAGDAGVETRTSVVDGAPAEALAELARENGAEEIVVGSRGMGRFAARSAARTRCSRMPTVPSSWCPKPPPITPATPTPTAGVLSSSATTDHRRARRCSIPRGAPGAVAASSPCTRSAGTIVAAADARDADEIVIGSRGFGRLRGVLGSVSHAVLHEADRPVVAIPADASLSTSASG